MNLEELRLKAGDLERIRYKGSSVYDPHKIAECPGHDWEVLNPEYVEDGLKFVDHVCTICGAVDTVCIGDTDDDPDPDPPEPEISPGWDLEPEGKYGDVWDYKL